MLSPLETGITWGDPGAWEEPGDRSLHGCLAPAGGTRREHSRATGRAWRGEAGQGPPSHTWGALSDSAQQERFCPAGTPSSRTGAPAVTGMPAAMTRVTAMPVVHAQGGSEHPWPGFLHDLIRTRPGASCPACWPCPARTALTGGLPAWQENCLPAGCAQRCG